jgi:hypothetical protein
MSETERKARKQHECERCDYPIRPGDYYIEYKGKSLLRDEWGAVYSAWYSTLRYHRYCLHPFGQYEKHECHFVTQYYSDEYGEWLPEIHLDSTSRVRKVCTICSEEIAL